MVIFINTLQASLISFNVQIYGIGIRIISTKGKEQEAAKRELSDCLKVWEPELGDRPFFGGETLGTLGLVDIALIPFYSWFYGYEQCSGFSIKTQCRELIAWAKICSQKGTVSRSLANRKKVSGFMLELKKRFGSIGSKRTEDVSRMLVCISIFDVS
ncbi:hypothetical protein BT93_L1823 [Corymbia citriodora subsp. variegata]|uniref:GST C-terminal domain-containing protein n=1 Tax=Corymbia citriodora subsp. variegata TaxID=360336 RepID=A0A8T0CR83_CORYI|nr:hypothetical protein BT93_L1823 [Corymbia citriodora subsp. variegata]